MNARGLAVFLLMTLVSSAQSAYQPPRTASGKPDLSGIWQVMNTAEWNVEDHAASAGNLPQLGAIGASPAGVSVVEGGTIPYLPEAAAKRKENFAKRWTEDPEIKCYLPGVPRATYLPFPFQIVESDKTILFSYEYDGAARIVNMDSNKEAPIDSWMGWSNGHWEGDTLVVDVTGLNDKTWFDRAGNFHSDALHVVERYTPRGSGMIHYEALIEDPKTFSRPWKMSMILYRHQEPNARLLEFKCVEFVEELMYGPLRKKTGGGQ
jgi:hypothetical protein